jgi:Fe-S cluster biogenesis protein NfuA
MLVHVISMHMVEMAIVKIIHVALMANGGMSTIRAMRMGVVGMVFLGTCGHCRRSLRTARVSFSTIIPSL